MILYNVNLSEINRSSQCHSRLYSSSQERASLLRAFAGPSKDRTRKQSEHLITLIILYALNIPPA